MYNRISLTKKTKKRPGQDVGQEVRLKGVRKRFERRVVTKRPS